jgi:hypothetical protein
MRVFCGPAFLPRSGFTARGNSIFAARPGFQIYRAWQIRFLFLRHFPVHTDPAIRRDEITTRHTGVNFLP